MTFGIRQKFIRRNEIDYFDGQWKVFVRYTSRLSILMELLNAIESAIHIHSEAVRNKNQLDIEYRAEIKLHWC